MHVPIVYRVIQAMQHGVFDDGQQEQRQYGLAGGVDRAVDVQFVGKASLMTELLDVQVSPDQIQLAAEQYSLVGRLQHAAKEYAQLADHSGNFTVVVENGLHMDAFHCIEQKMRIDLVCQQLVLQLFLIAQVFLFAQLFFVDALIQILHDLYGPDHVVKQLAKIILSCQRVLYLQLSIVDGAHLPLENDNSLVDHVDEQIDQQKSGQQ